MNLENKILAIHQNIIESSKRIESKQKSIEDKLDIIIEYLRLNNPQP